VRVLIIGGSGHVGTLVLPYLAEHHELTVFDLRPPAEPAHSTFVRGDLRDARSVRGAVDGSDAVVFMAMGPTTGWGSPDNARTHLEVAVAGLNVALQTAHDADIPHAVYTSSMSVYNTPSGRRQFPDESVPPDATNFYGLAKRLGEEVCRNAVLAWDMSVVALRLCHPTADAEFPRSDAPSLTRTISTSARDTARALLAALEYRGHGFEAFCISGDAGEQRVSLAKARTTLGWEPLDSTA
jgi:nucleoside-diphosphate-sugar epimerase